MVRLTILLPGKPTYNFSQRKIKLALWGLLALAFIMSMLCGRLSIRIEEICRMAAVFFKGKALTGELIPKELVFFWVRLPRCLMAMLVGAALSVSGAVYQGIFRNPLVSPDILGVSAGCTFGAALGLILPFQSIWWVHLLSLIFGLIAVCLSVMLARAISIKPVIVLVLSGMVVLSFFNALLMAVKYFSDPYDELPSIIFWVMGSLTRISWENVWIMAPAGLIFISMFLVFSFRLNILSLGDVQAKSLGMNPAFYRKLFIVASSILVALATATCGQILWVGLVVPHLARSLSGPEHEKMLPVTALTGALFLLLADTAARSISEAEIPVGIVTALVGAPVFGFIMYKNRRTGWL